MSALEAARFGIETCNRKSDLRYCYGEVALVGALAFADLTRAEVLCVEK